MKESEKSPTYYSIGRIMGSTSLIYQKIDNMKVMNKEKILEIVKQEIKKIDGELKKLSDCLEEGVKC